MVNDHGIFYFTLSGYFSEELSPFMCGRLSLYKQLTMKEFLLLLRENIEAYGKMSPEEMQKDIETHVKWVEELSKNGHFKHGNPLSPTGNMLSGQQKLKTDGPYIEGKEGISGFYFLLANSLEEATELAKGCPTLAMGGNVEVREVFSTQ